MTNIFNPVIQELNELKPNERCIYYVGYLVEDAGKDTSVFNIGQEAQRLSDKGKVHLFQNKLGPFMYQYIAVGASAGRRR